MQQAVNVQKTIEASLRSENLRLVNKLVQVEAERDAALARLAALERTQGLNFYAPRCLRVTAAQEKMLAMLMSRERASREELHAYLYAHDPQGGADIKIIDVQISKMRTRLAMHGMEIISVHGRGFELTTATKQRIREMREAELK